MRFLADMGISPQTVLFLREEGHDAVHLLDRGLSELEDPNILELAKEERRILLAHDLDFSDLVAAGTGALPSVVVFRLRDMRPGHVNDHLRLLMDRYRDELEGGSIFSVREGRFRWRSLPLDLEA